MNSKTERRQQQAKPAKLPRKNRAAIVLLRKWREEGNAEEQRATGSYLRKALDEDRPANLKLFP